MTKKVDLAGAHYKKVRWQHCQASTPVDATEEVAMYICSAIMYGTKLYARVHFWSSGWKFVSAGSQVAADS